MASQSRAAVMLNADAFKNPSSGAIRLEIVSAHWHIQSTRGRQLNYDERLFGSVWADAANDWSGYANVMLGTGIDQFCDMPHLFSDPAGFWVFSARFPC